MKQDAENISLLMRNKIDESLHTSMYSTTPLMYDPNKMQGKVSFSILETRDGDNAYLKRFNVTVEDLNTGYFYNDNTVINGKYLMTIKNFQEILDLIGEDDRRIRSIMADLSREIPFENIFVATDNQDTCWLFQVKKHKGLNIELEFTGTAK
jgi:hypothetical protein